MTGESVGHYETGDTLVVDTIGLDDKGPLDRYRTPHTKQMHVVERFKLARDKKSIEISFTVEDPGAFTMPWKAKGRLARRYAAALGSLGRRHLRRQWRRLWLRSRRTRARAARRQTGFLIAMKALTRLIFSGVIVGLAFGTVAALTHLQAQPASGAQGRNPDFSSGGKAWVLAGSPVFRKVPGDTGPGPVVSPPGKEYKFGEQNACRDTSTPILKAVGERS
jgi:hypothetical protein